MRLLVSRHLENFLALYETGNMHKASENKGKTQPALAKSLKTLEDEIGSRLFTRTPKGLEPTEAGRKLYRHARSIDQQSRFAALDIDNIVGRISGQIRIGVGPGLAASSFPRVLVDFNRQFPGVHCVVQVGMTRQLVDELLLDNLDVIATARPQESLPDHFSSVHLFDIRMAAVCRHDHPLLSERRIEIDQLSRYGCITFPESHEFFKQTRAIFGQSADKIRVVMEANSVSVMLELVNSTDYFAFIGDIIVPRAKQAGLAQLTIPDLLWTMNIDLMCKHSLIDTKPIRHLSRSLV